MDINGVTISGGDSVTVSVDVFGTLAGAGGVVFIELISRDSGGNETGRSFIGPAPIFPTAAWATESSTVNVAADVIRWYNVAAEIQLRCRGRLRCRCFFRQRHHDN